MIYQKVSKGARNNKWNYEIYRLESNGILRNCSESHETCDYNKV